MSPVSAPVDAQPGAEQILKPDYSTTGKHFIFTDEHEQLRETVRAFAKKELAPHAEEWEEKTFPDSVFHRMGELERLDQPVEHRVRQRVARIGIVERDRRHAPADVVAHHGRGTLPAPRRRPRSDP